LTICDNLHERSIGVRILTGKLSGTYGESPTQIAKALGVSRASVYRHLAAVSTPAAS
jgi:transposase